MDPDDANRGLRPEAIRAEVEEAAPAGGSRPETQ